MVIGKVKEQIIFTNYDEMIKTENNLNKAEIMKACG